MKGNEMNRFGRTLAGLLTALALAAPATGQAIGSVPGAEVQLNTRPVNVAAQVKDDLFAGTEKFAQGASDVTEVNLDPKMMEMIPDKKAGSAELAHKMNFIVIHTYSYDKPGMYRQEDVDVYRRKLTDGSWSCAIHVKEKDETTDICSRTGADHESTEMVIMSAEPRELTFIHLSGRMSLSDLQKMGNKMGSH